MATPVPLDDLPGESQQRMRYNDPTFDDFTAQTEQKYGLPNGVLLALKNAGEKSNPTAVSPKGARGVMQFMPETAKQYGVDVSDQASVIDGAGRFMKDLLQQYGGNVQAAVAHYNGGTAQGKRVASGEQPSYPETQRYVVRVNNAIRAVPAREMPTRPATPQGGTAVPENDLPDAIRASVPAGEPEQLTITGSALENAAAGAGKAISDTGQGLKQIGAKIGNLLGVVDDETVQKIQQEIDEASERDKPLMSTGGGLVGNIAGNIATAAVPGTALGLAAKAGRFANAVKTADVLEKAAAATALPKTVKGAAAIGAAQGAVGPVTSEDGELGRLKAASIGGLASTAGQTIASGLARVIQPIVRPEVRTLINEGVTPTPGQIIGGKAQVVEDKLRSFPIVGDSIAAAQRRGVEDLNRAAINRIVEPLNRVIKPAGSAGAVTTGAVPQRIVIKEIGHDGVEKAGEAVSKAYDDLLPKLTGVRDKVFNQETANLTQMAANSGMADAQIAQFNTILNNRVLGRFTQHGRMSGETMKDVESELGTNIRRFSRSENPNDQMLADALRETQASLRRMTERVNPAHAGELQNINEAYANLLRVENAAGRLGSREGVFSPAGLRGASRQMDTSLRKRATARGNALMQDLADAGENVLGAKYPDSGTAGRLGWGALASGAAGGAFAGIPLAVPTAVAAGAGMYTTPMVRAIAAMLTKRPDVAVPIANAVRATGPGLALSTPGIALAIREALQSGQ